MLKSITSIKIQYCTGLLSIGILQKEVVEHPSISVSIVLRFQYSKTQPPSQFSSTRRPDRTVSRRLEPFNDCDVPANRDISFTVVSTAIHRQSLNLWQCFQRSILHYGCLQLLYMTYIAHSNNVTTGYNVCINIRLCFDYAHNIQLHCSFPTCCALH